MSPTLQPGTPQNIEGTVTDAESCGWSGTFLASTHVLTLIGTWGGGVNPNPHTAPSHEGVPGTRHLLKQKSPPPGSPLPSSMYRSSAGPDPGPLRPPGQDLAVGTVLALGRPSEHAAQRDPAPFSCWLLFLPPEGLEQGHTRVTQPDGQRSWESCLWIRSKLGWESEGGAACREHAGRRPAQPPTGPGPGDCEEAP